MPVNTRKICEKMLEKNQIPTSVQEPYKKSERKTHVRVTSGRDHGDENPHEKEAQVQNMMLQQRMLLSFPCLFTPLASRSRAQRLAL
jgi:hypothetical protein